MALHIRGVAKRMWRLALLGCAAFLVVLVMIAAMMLATEGGRIMLLNQAVTLVNLRSPFQLELVGIRSPAISRWQFAEIRWRGSNTLQAIDLTDVSIDWQWQQLMQNRWQFGAIDIGQLQAAMGEPQLSSGGNFSWFYQHWSKLPELRFARLTIQQLSLSRPNYPALSARISSELAINWEGTPLAGLFSISDANSDNEFALQLDPASIGEVRIAGAVRSAPGTSWAQWFHPELNEPLQADWNLHIDHAQPAKLTITIEEADLPWEQHQLQVAGQVVYDIDPVAISFRPLTLMLDGEPAVLNGTLAERESDLQIEMTDWRLDPFAAAAGYPELGGQMQMAMLWLGGWRTPRIEGSLSANGYWQRQPFTLVASSLAQLNQLQVNKADLQIANNRLSASGTIDWTAAEAEFAVTGALSADPFWRPYLPKELADIGGQASFDGRLYGPLDDLSLALVTQLVGQWQAKDWQLQANLGWHNDSLVAQDVVVRSSLLAMAGALEWWPDSNEWQSRWQVDSLTADLLSQLQIDLAVPISGVASGLLSATGTGTDFVIAGDVNLQGQWQILPMSLQMQIDALTPERLTFSAGEINLDSARITAEGFIDWQRADLDLRLQHENWPLSTLTSWLPDGSLLQSFTGEWSGVTHLAGPWSTPAMTTDSRVQGEWLAQPLRLSLSTKADSAARWQINEFDAQWLKARWQYQGDFFPYVLEAEGQARVTDLSFASLPILSTALTGQPLTVPADQLRLSADVSVKGALVAPALTGNINIQGALEQQPLDVQVGFSQLDRQQIMIERARGTWAGGYWELAGPINWHTRELALTINTDSPDITHLLPLLQSAGANLPAASFLEQWQGSLSGDLYADNTAAAWVLAGELSSQGQFMGIDYQLQWQGQGSPAQALDQNFALTWGRAELIGELRSAANDLTGEASITGLAYQQLEALQEGLPKEVSGLIDGHITLSGDPAAPTVAAELGLRGQVIAAGTYPFELYLDASGNQQSWRIHRAIAEVGRQASLTLSGHGEGLNGDLQLEGLFSETSSWFSEAALPAGDARLQLTVSGDLTAPDMAGNLRWRADTEPVSLLTTLSTEPEHYQLESKAIAREQIEVSALLLWPRANWNRIGTGWQQRPLELAVTMDTDLGLWDSLLLNQPDIQFGGQLQGTWQMTGSLNAPLWAGQINWRDGIFEHARYGTRLGAIGMQVVGAGSRWQFSGRGADNMAGTTAVTGSIDFLGNAQRALAHSIDLQVRLDKAAFLNQPQLEAVATGNLQMSGSYHQLELGGDLQVNNLTLQLDTLLTEGIPQLNIVSAVATDLSVERLTPFYWPQGRWDLSLNASNQAKLIGQGIEAELTGTLNVNGDLYAPDLFGRFELLRGFYTGLGGVFDLRDGLVQLQNAQLAINLQGEQTAQVEIDGIVEPLPITLQISGTQSSLALALSSTSSLDQDELLAQLLFGKIVADLDIIQAYQLGNAINALRTRNSGFDVLASARDAFALNTLRVNSDSDDDGNLQLNVSAGKYLSDSLYLEVEQEVGSAQDFRGSLQYRLIPGSNLEFYTQGQGGQLDNNGVELNWSLDY